MMKTFVWIFLLLLAGVLRSEPVTPEMAKTAAAAWLRDNPNAAKGVGLSGAEPRAEVADDGSVLWYEVPTDAGGCVITSSDNDIEPIVSYVEDWGGPLPADHPLRALLVADLANRLAVVRREAAAPRLMQVASPASTAASPRTTADVIAAWRRRWTRLTSGRRLLAANKQPPDFIVSFIPDWREKRLTHWNQGRKKNIDGDDVLCYNLYTPSNYVCGCVATAGSSLLQFFNVTKGPDPDTAHVCGVGKNYHVLLKPIGGDYDWTILPLSWANKPGVDDEQAELMGRVAYDMGVCCKMGYSAGGSGASERDLATALRVDYVFSSALWVGKASVDMRKHIYAQNRAGVPVGLAISKNGTSSGHSVVAVGYARDLDGTSYTHVFMGWAGTSDAWYALPDMGSSFNSVDGVVTRISRDRDSIALCGRVLTETGKAVGFADVELDSGHVFRTDPNGFWAGRVPETNEQHVAVCCGVKKVVGFDDDAADIDFTVPDEATEGLSNPADVDLDEALAAQGKAGGTVSAVRLGNAPSVSGKTDLFAAVVMADGTECVISNGVTWKVAAGDAAFFRGRTLVPTATAEDASMVVVMGEVWLRGRQYAFFSRVQVLDGLTVTGLDDITGPESLDLYYSPTAVFSTQVTLSDGTKREMPLVWTAQESRGSNAVVSTVGVLSFASYDFEGEEEVVVTAACGGFSKSKTVRVMSPGGVLQYGGYFDKNVIWPGAALTCFPTCVRHERHGVVEDPMDASDGDLSAGWILYRLVSNQWHNVSDGDGFVVPLPENMPFDHNRTHLVCTFAPRSGRYELNKRQKVEYEFALTNAVPENLVTVSFKTGDDGPVLEPMTCLAGRAFGSLPDLPKKGYSTVWTDPDGATVTKSTLVPDADTVLTCILKTNAYQVVFNRNGGTSGSMQNQSFLYDQAAALKKNAFRRPYYLFAGWALTADGPIVYGDGETVLNLSEKNNAKITLYAVWEKAPLTESVLLSPDWVVDPAQLKVQLSFADGTTSTTFESLTWRIAAGDAAEVSDDGILTPVPGGDGTVTVAAEATVRGEAFRLEKSVRIVNPAYVADLRIVGPTVWVPHQPRESLALRLVGTLDGQEVEFAAKSWRVDWMGANGEAFDDYYKLAEDGTITLASDGKTGAGTVSATIGSRTVTLPLRTLSLSRDNPHSTCPASNVMYPGAEIPLNLLVTLRYADGTVRKLSTFEDPEIYFGRVTYKDSAGYALTFPADAMPSFSTGRLIVPETATCRRDGWDGVIVIGYAFGIRTSSGYMFSNYKLGSFYWQEQVPDELHAVVFDANGGRFKDGTAECEIRFLPGRPYGIFPPSPTRLGYSFLNWYTAAEGGTKITTASDAVAGVERLYAQWKTGTAASLTVKFHANFGTDEIKVQTFTRDEIAAGQLKPNEFARTGWAFDGWATTAELSQKSVRYADGAPLADLSFTSTLDLYAVWRPLAGGYVLVPGTDLMLPMTWLEGRGLVSLTGGDPVRATLMPAANGRPAWACYVAGLDPLDPKDDLTVRLSFDGGQPVLDYDRKDDRVYVEEGRPSLSEGDWHVRKEGDRFFRVSVSLPPQSR